MSSISVPMPGVAPAPRPKLSEYLRWSVDHKIIGVQYMAMAIVMFIVGGGLAMLFRWELLTPAQDFLANGSAYNSVFTMHATIMIFAWIIPMFAGLGNYIVPLQLGAKDMAFPWLNAFAFWLLVPAGVLLALSFFVSPAEAGWTAYPPLSVQFSGDGQTLWGIAVHIYGLSSILGAINFIVTIKNMRPEGMGYFQMPLFCWATLATSFIQVLATPFLAGGITLLLLDRVAGTAFFDPDRGGDVLVWQNVFWFYSHPAVYIMVLPGMGIISEVLAIHSRKPIFGYRMIAFSSLGIALIGFTVWAHHMFTSLTPELRIPFMITSYVISIPTGIKIFGWIGTMWGGKLRLGHPALLFAIGFLSQFVIGGITGMMLGAVPVDIHLHDTYFVVSHFHFVLFGGSVFAIYAGIYHWWPKITGRMLNHRWGVIHFVITYLSFFFTFFPQHLAGMQGMPRRVAEYAPEFQSLNILISISSFVLGVSTFIIIINMLWSIFRGPVASSNPWRALTLEWQTSSPPPPYNFKGMPVPFEDPYGYGSEAGAAYMDAMIERLTPGALLRSGKSSGPALPASEPVSGD